MLESLSSINWREPVWLLLMFTPIVIWIGKHWLQVSKNSYAEAHLNPWAIVPDATTLLQRIATKTTVYILAWILLSIVAAGPRQAMESSHTQQSTDMDIMLVLDVSRSMRATDIFPSRLQRAHIEIEEFLERAAGKRVGVIVFAARPHVLVPLTSDHAALRFYLESLNDIQLPTMGSVPELALSLARAELQRSNNPTAIVLMSDGDFNTSLPEGLDAENATLIYTLGIGGKDGEAIQLENGQWLKYKDQQVITSLKEKNLIEIADSGPFSHYIRAQEDDSDWKFIYDEGIVKQLTNNRSNEAVVESEIRVSWKQLYQWPLFVSICLLWFSLVPYRLGFKGVVRTFRKRLNKIANRKSLAWALSKSALFVLIMTLFMVPLFMAQPMAQQGKLWAAGIVDISIAELVNDRQAYKKYIKGEYPEALKIYRDIPGYHAYLGAASSLYKMKEFNAAIRQFSKAVVVAQSDFDRAVALYNLANSYFKSGDYSSAVSVYRDALRYRPGHKSTLYNLNFSQELKTAVEASVNQMRHQGQVGNGPQARAGELNESVSSAGSIFVDEDPGVVSDSKIDPALYNMTESMINELIRKGMSKVRLAAVNTTTPSGDTIIVKINRLNVSLRNMPPRENQNLLWKRLFEMEEGFPAPLDQARALPGIPPW